MPETRTAEQRRDYLRSYRARPENKEKEQARGRNRSKDPESKAKRAEYQREYRAKNPEKIKAVQQAYAARNQEKRRKAYRNYSLKKRYGITIEEKNALFEAQGFACAACGAPDEGGKKWHVDHCHRQGHVRAILCSNCNVALGQVNDSVEHLRKLISYLEGNHA